LPLAIKRLLVLSLYHSDWYEKCRADQGIKRQVEAQYHPRGYINDQSEPWASARPALDLIYDHDVRNRVIDLYQFERAFWGRSLLDR